MLFFVNFNKHNSIMLFRPSNNICEHVFCNSRLSPHFISECWSKWLFFSLYERKHDVLNPMLIFMSDKKCSPVKFCMKNYFYFTFYLNLNLIIFMENAKMGTGCSILFCSAYGVLHLNSAS